MEARTSPFADLRFKPRFSYGEMCEIGEILGGRGSSLGFGFARMSGANIPWQTHYDEVLLVIEGELRVITGDRVLVAGPRDSIVLPRGTDLVYEADHALAAYAIHPADWAEQR